MKVNWLVVDVGLGVYIITSLLNGSLVASWVMWLAMVLPLIHVCKKSNDEIKERKMLNDHTKKAR